MPLSSFFMEREVDERAAREDRGAVKAVEVPRQRDVAARTREDFIIMDGTVDGGGSRGLWKNEI